MLPYKVMGGLTGCMRNWVTSVDFMEGRAREWEEMLRKVLKFC